MMEIRYLNTDLEIESENDLSLIVEEFGKDVFVLHHGEIRGYQHASFEIGRGIEMRFRLRPANSSDFDFIWRLRAETMKAVISEAYGWDEETQREIAAESLAGEIVLVDEEPVGVLTLADWGDQLHLTWMAILPEMQGQGLGGELLEHCQRRAIEAGKPITLQVLRNNPAIRLYERFGFKAYAYNGHQVLMRWNHNAE